MTERQPGRPSRRTVLRWGLGVTGAAMADQLPRIPEFLNPGRSEILFDARQTELMKQRKAACIVFGGSNFSTAERITEWLSPSLEPLGGAGSVRYAKNGIDAKSIAKELLRLKGEGVKEFSFFGSSLGTQVAGQTMLELWDMGEDIRINHILMDCTPPSLEYLNQPVLAEVTNDLPPSGSITGGVNWFVHKRPFAADGTYAGLWDEQLQTLHHGEFYLQILANAARRHRSHVSLLRPADISKDTLVDEKRSEPRLAEFFPQLRVYPVWGDHQQHGIFPLNKDGYHEAIGWALKEAA